MTSFSNATLFRLKKQGKNGLSSLGQCCKMAKGIRVDGTQTSALRFHIQPFYHHNPFSISRYHCISAGLHVTSILLVWGLTGSNRRRKGAKERGREWKRKREVETKWSSSSENRTHLIAQQPLEFKHPTPSPRLSIQIGRKSLCGDTRQFRNEANGKWLSINSASCAVQRLRPAMEAQAAS